MIWFVIGNSLERHIVATSSFGQIVVLDDDMADRIIESNKTANDYPFGQPTGFFKHATDDDVRRMVKLINSNGKRK